MTEDTHESNSNPIIEKPWTRSVEETLDALDVSPEEGLDTSQIRERRKKYGRNELREAETRSVWSILLEQFKSVIVLLLAVAAIVSFLFGETIEGIAIVVVIVLNAAIGFVTELQAVRSMEALQRLSSVEAKVRREGHVEEIPAEEIVPGDIVLVSGGDVVTADLRLIEVSKLQANEAALTGESLPISKHLEPQEEETPLAERENMLFKGTAVTRGAGEGVVVATGMDTELGHISSLVEEAEEAATPLEERLEQLGRRLVYATLGVGAVVTLSGIVVGKDVVLMIETGIALAVASIPEGLPIVATVALARGMWRMAQRNALINRLSAVETLGATNVILTDKTGTLTESQMTVTHAVLASGQYEVAGEGLEVEGRFERDGKEIDPVEDDILQKAAEIGVLCNDASLSPEEDSSVGDPSEVALLVLGRKVGLTRDELLEEMPEEREVAFDPEVKMMATFHRLNGRYEVAVKGALERVLENSTRFLSENGRQDLSEEDRQKWQEEESRMAEEGLRVMALAFKDADSDKVDPYSDLTFVGLVGLADPPRHDVQDAIEACHSAGIKVVMVTGDQPATARSIAKEVGIIQDEDQQVLHGNDFGALEEMDDQERQNMREVRVLARFSPKQKLDLIALHQGSGAIVAMTGDGVNDAPALKKADIGVAMGKRGTQVAKEASDMILQDDAFSTIVLAVEQGRVIFDNIRKFVLYLLSCNVAEVMVVGLAALVNAPLPILPLQILFLNLVTDVFPALALGAGRGEQDVMKRSPRDPDESIMTVRHWRAIAGYGGLITVATLGSFAIALLWLEVSNSRAVTISFLTLAFAQLWHVFNMRSPRSGFVSNDIVRNKYVWGALVLCTLLLLGATYLPFLSNILDVVDPGPIGWSLVIGMSLFPWLVGQVLKTFSSGREGQVV